MRFIEYLKVNIWGYIALAFGFIGCATANTLLKETTINIITILRIVLSMVVALLSLRVYSWKVDTAAAKLAEQLQSNDT